jgi:hypothetical protein
VFIAYAGGHYIEDEMGLAASHWITFLSFITIPSIWLAATCVWLWIQVRKSGKWSERNTGFLMVTIFVWYILSGWFFFIYGTAT